MKENIQQIIGITGMPGSGKSELSQHVSSFDFHVVIMGDVIREKVRECGEDPTPQACNEMMLALRKKHGKAAVAHATYSKIEKLVEEGFTKFIIDGIRSQDEVNYFREQIGDKFVIICVHVAPRIRFERLKERKRKDAPKTFEEFNERDKTELSVGLGETIATFANYIINNNEDISSLQKTTHKLVKHLLKMGN